MSQTYYIRTVPASTSSVLADRPIDTNSPPGLTPAGPSKKRPALRLPVPSRRPPPPPRTTSSHTLSLAARSAQSSLYTHAAPAHQTMTIDIAPCPAPVELEVLQRQRARAERDARARLVAGMLLNRVHAPRPIRRRSKEGVPYVRSSLGCSVVSAEA